MNSNEAKYNLKDDEAYLSPESAHNDQDEKADSIPDDHSNHDSNNDMNDLVNMNDNVMNAKTYERAFRDIEIIQGKPVSQSQDVSYMNSVNSTDSFEKANQLLDKINAALNDPNYFLLNSGDRQKGNLEKLINDVEDFTKDVKESSSQSHDSPNKPYDYYGKSDASEKDQEDNIGLHDNFDPLPPRITNSAVNHEKGLLDETPSETHRNSKDLDDINNEKRSQLELDILKDEGVLGLDLDQSNSKWASDVENDQDFMQDHLLFNQIADEFDVEKEQESVLYENEENTPRDFYDKLANKAEHMPVDLPSPHQPEMFSHREHVQNELRRGIMDHVNGKIHDNNEFSNLVSMDKTDKGNHEKMADNDSGKDNSLEASLVKLPKNESQIKLDSEDINNAILGGFDKSPYEDEHPEPVNENIRFKTPHSSERLSKVSKVDLNTSELHFKARRMILGSEYGSEHSGYAAKGFAFQDNIVSSSQSNDNEGEESEEDDEDDDTPCGTYIHPDAKSRIETDP